MAWASATERPAQLMKTTVAATLALCALAVCAGAFHLQETRAAAREAALKQELARLGQRVDAMGSAQQSAMAKAILEHGSREGTAVLGVASAASGARLAAAEPPATLDPETMEQRKAKAAESRAERARAFDDYLRSESVDKPWSDAMVAAAYRVVGVAKTARLIKTECASRLCRIVVDHADTAEQRSFAAQVWQDPPFDNGIFFRYDTSGPRPQTTLYVAREGTELASLIPPQ